LQTLRLDIQLSARHSPSMKWSSIFAVGIVIVTATPGTPRPNHHAAHALRAARHHAG
jgi:hypothetical protein